MVNQFEDTAILPSDLPSDPSLSIQTCAFLRETSRGTDLPTNLLFTDTPDGKQRTEVEERPPFLLRSKLSSGAHGEIWEAVQVALNRIVAVKRPILTDVDPHRSNDIERAFKREALTTAHLAHPNIVPTYDFGLDPDGRPVMAMKLISGDPWDKLLAASSDDPIHNVLLKHLPVLLSVARAVAFAHSRGVVHRDIKPAQVVVGEFGEVYLIDWGQAVAVPGGQEDGLSATEYATPRENAQCPAGTPAYMAPEQTLSSCECTGPWTDVYLLGGMLYHLLTGSPPHPHATSTEAFLHAARGELTPPREMNTTRELSAELCDLCMRAMQADINKRLQSAEEFADNLDAFISGTQHRAESLMILADAKAQLELAGGEYQRLNAVGALITRSLELWPESPAARHLESQLYARCAATALAKGDRRLARVQVAHIQDESVKGNILAKVDAADRTAERQIRQRRFALRSSMVLAAIAVMVLCGMLLYRAQEIRRQARAKLDAQVLLEAAKTEKRHLERSAANAATNRQLALIRKLRDEFVRSSSLKNLRISGFATDPEWTSARLKIEREYLQLAKTQIDQINDLRLSLAKAGVDAGPGSYEFLNSLGALQIAFGTTESLRDAYRSFAKAAEIEPFEYNPRVNMAITALRLDEIVSASTHTHEAAYNLTFAENMYPETILQLRQMICEKRARQVSLSPDDIIIESRAPGKNSHQFRKLSGNWESSSERWTHKSAAPGLTHYSKCLVEWFTFYEPFRRTENKGMGIALFEPKFRNEQRRHVYVTWPGMSNAWPVYFRVRHADGDTTFVLAQNGIGLTGKENANVWVHLGQFNFRGGENEHVAMEVGQDARAFNPQRFGMAAADAVLFAVQPISDQYIDWSEASVQPQIRGPIADPESSPPLEIKWVTDLSVMDAPQTRPAVIYSYYPASSFMTHPINRNRDYCENRHFYSSSVARALQQVMPVKLDLSHHSSVASRLNLPTDATSIAILTAEGKIADLITGDDLLISPPELAQKIQKVVRR